MGFIQYSVKKDSTSVYLAITATAAPAMNVYENEGNGGNGYMGFYMDWWQNKC